MQVDDAGAARLRAALVDYMEHHWDAADTLEGIMNWWLPAEYRAVDPSAVEKTLEIMVADGLVTVSRLVDRRVLYRRAAKS